MAIRVDVTRIGHGSWVSRVPAGVAAGHGHQPGKGPVPCTGCGLPIHPNRMEAHKRWCSNANVAYRAAYGGGGK